MTKSQVDTVYRKVLKLIETTKRMKVKPGRVDVRDIFNQDSGDESVIPPSGRGSYVGSTYVPDHSAGHTKRCTVTDGGEETNCSSLGGIDSGVRVGGGSMGRSDGRSASFGSLTSPSRLKKGGGGGSKVRRFKLVLLN